MDPPLEENMSVFEVSDQAPNSKESAMIGCLRTCVHKQPIIALYFEFETVLKFYDLGARYGSIQFTQHIKGCCHC